jgi:hypothetical protein
MNRHHRYGLTMKHNVGSLRRFNDNTFVIETNCCNRLKLSDRFRMSLSAKDLVGSTRSRGSKGSSVGHIKATRVQRTYERLRTARTKTKRTIRVPWLVRMLTCSTKCGK